MRESLLQHTLYEDPQRIAVRLPLGEELETLHPGGCFPLLRDPLHADRACIVGMLVLRPALHPWLEPAVAGDGSADSMYRVRQWCFDVEGASGSWPIAAGNPVDAYRLALQYGVVDAVIVGSRTAAVEGVDHGSVPGYLWQPYGPVRWPRLAADGEALLDAILRLRARWQDLGVLSRRRYPAQIVVTQSGEPEPGLPDILDARIFSEPHPDGTPIEVHVLTSNAGAERLRRRVRARAMEPRIENAIVSLSPSHDPTAIDVAAVPAWLRARLDVRIAEHDGGATVLWKFLRAGAVTQLNLTLMHGRAVRDVLAASDRLDPAGRQAVLASLGQRARLFFGGDGAIPRSVRPACVVGSRGEAVFVTLDPASLRDAGSTAAA